MIHGLTVKKLKKSIIFCRRKIYKKYYDAVLIAVAHQKFKKTGFQTILESCKKNHVIYDLKSMFKSNLIDMRL